jgi:glycosyltransferase involved in cell wall biosynthesis
MPRLLLLFEYPTLHGGEHSLLAVLPFVREAGFEVFALAPGEGELAQALLTQGVEVQEFGPARSAGDTAPQDVRRRRLAAAIARLRPDLVHANSLSMSRLSGPVASEMRIPSVGHLRDIVTLSRQAAADVNRHTRLLAVSRATRDWHLAYGLDGERTLVCYNGVDLARFHPQRPTGFLHAELNLPHDAALVGSVGQVVLRKGLDIAMEAMLRLAPHRPALHWIIAGERFSQKAEAMEYERRLRETAARPPLAGRVHFLGVRQDVCRLLNELTLLFHPARQEPLGRVLLEAAATGLPVVATDVGGTPEILPRETFAELLVPPDDPEAFATAAARLLEDPPLREQLGARLRDRAAAAFAAPDAAVRLLDQYGAVLAQKLS